MTYYEVLEIDSRASTDEVERAYRRLARKVHPDLNAGDPAKAEARMKLLNEIRDTLTDPLLRAGYDERLRLEAPRPDAVGPPPGTTPAPEGPAGMRRAPLGYAPSPAPGRRWSSVWVSLFLVALGAGVVVAALFSNPRLANRLPDPFESSAASVDAAVNADADIAPLLTTPVSATSRASSVAVPEARRARPRGRVVVRLGSSADDVLRLLGQPDGYEPGRRPGESVLRYGRLRLEMKNGRVVGGDAAAR
jgi:curved DNA-binding protein CbpA